MTASAADQRAPVPVLVLVEGEGAAGASPSAAAAGATEGDLFAAAGMAPVAKPEPLPPPASVVVLREIEVEVFPDGTMTRENAARYLGISPHTLAGWAHLKIGPRYMKLQRKTFYRKVDLDLWKAQRFAEG